MPEAGADADEDGGDERPLAARAEEPPRAPEHEPDGRGVGEEPDGARRRLEAQAEAVDRGEHDHEQEVGRAVDGLLADVPDDAVPGRQVAGVAHQHGGVLFGPPAQVELGPHVPADEEQQQEARRPVAPVEAGRPLPGHQCVSPLARADARQLR